MFKKQDKAPLGRPTVITEDVLRKLEQAYSLDCTDEEACAYAEIGTTALYEYQKRNPAFAERKRQLKDKQILKARSVIAEAMNKGDRDVAKWYLERKRKDEFSNKTESTVTNFDGGKIDMEVVKKMNEKLRGID